MENEILSNEIVKYEQELLNKIPVSKGLSYKLLVSIFQKSLDSAQENSAILKDTGDQVYKAYFDGRISAYKEVIGLLRASV